MTAEGGQSIFKGVDLHPKDNNLAHHTSVLSDDRLVVRRGKPFKVTFNLGRPLSGQPLTLKATTGQQPSEEQGTLSLFGLTPVNGRSPSAKAVWKAELHGGASLQPGLLVLSITPPADAPIGEFRLVGIHQDESRLLGTLVVLYNPWCPDDWVHMKDEMEINEYVMNEKGVIFKGSNNYIISANWDYGQFQDKMVDICLRILDVNHKHSIDPADDVSARCNPIYVSRVVSAMINSEDDSGVLVGRWDGRYGDGYTPAHWTGSHAILKRWFDNGCSRVKYGQCWVFAGVMCSVMRLLGIPCRVVTNYQSAHDNNKNLIIDVYHADYGVRERPSPDSIWNYHVWVEAWMRRPDLAKDGAYDGWQVLDPTPQEKSDSIYCCGPSPVAAVLNGDTHLKYDVPFVFAEVNADCIDWLVKADGSMLNISTDTRRVGQNISTKAVGSAQRVDITSSYKYAEGTDKERSTFLRATTAEKEAKNEKPGDKVGSAGAEPPVAPPKPDPAPPVKMRIEQVTPPTDGNDVMLTLVLRTEGGAARLLSVNIKADAMRYNGVLGVTVHNEVKETTLLPGTDGSIPIRIKFSDYHKAMTDCDCMRVSAVATDKREPQNLYLAESDVMLLDPPITVNIPKTARVNREVQGELFFTNPLSETLTQCSLTLSGSGLILDELQLKIPDLKQSTRLCVRFPLLPYRSGKRTLLVDFDCSAFRNIKGSAAIDVQPSLF
ncbi:protein-glutamine gamma-glutamyltransferase 2 [Pungitius pungitius]|uniref:protein-glutamine gamma-glutamyltransferase 2 n=1 Tax=Pungitius pungitius TaxID=134920 RepID=UPI002E14C5DE